MRKAELEKAWCKGCGLCTSQCPVHALQIGADLNESGYRFAVVDAARCIGCGACYRVCPDMAFRIIEQEGTTWQS